MANVKGNALPAAASVALTDILIVVNPTTGVAYRTTVSAFIGNQLSAGNSTSVELTVTELNTTYSTAGIGFEVLCENLQLIYKKGSTTWWSIPMGGVSA